jgi:formate C-acetyltransferase
MSSSSSVVIHDAHESGEGRLTRRIAALREQAVACANEPDPAERGRAVMRSYDETRADPMAIRRAKAVTAALASATLVLDDGDLLAGRVPRRVPGHQGIHEGYWYKLPAAYPDLNSGSVALERSPLPQGFVESLRAWWQRHSGPCDKLAAARPEHAERAMRVGVYWASGLDIVHRNPRFEMLLERGVLDLREEAATRLDALNLVDAEDAARRVFYQSVIIVYDAMVGFANRWAKQLDALAAVEADPFRCGELRQMAEHCRQVPAHPPRTFWEVLQAVWLIVCMNEAEVSGSATSLGRLDQYLQPFYQADLAAGRLTREVALELIECLFLKCYRTFDFHYTMLGGQTVTGTDATNELSYLCLDALDALRTPRAVGVRIHRGSPPELLRRAADIAGHGLGRPDFWNDEVVIKALTRVGIPVADAREYSAIGCVELTIPGKCNSRTMGHAMNLLKVLELVLNEGRCMQTGTQVLQGVPAEFATYDDLHACYRHHAARLIREAVEEDARGYVFQSTELPFPVLSALTEGCLQSGRDVMAGGATYNPAGVNLFGVANVADSLAAISKLVFEERRVTFAELRTVLNSDFEGREDLRQLLLTHAPKFGNDDDSVDRIAAEEVAFYCSEIAKYSTPEGGRYHALVFGCTPDSVYSMGPKCGASADGRRAGKPLATSLNPTPGQAKTGATAELKSVSKVDLTNTPGGVSYILELHPTALDGPTGVGTVASLFRAFFDQGGMEISINVLGEEDLRNAQAHPQEHTHVLVRVFGFSAQFTSLDPPLQEYVIERTRQLGRGVIL